MYESNYFWKDDQLKHFIDPAKLPYFKRSLLFFCMQWQTTTAVEKTTSPKIWDAVLKNLTIGQCPIAREIPVPFWPSEKVFVAHKFIIGATKSVAVFLLSTMSRQQTHNIGVVAASYTTKRLVSAVGPKISYKTWLANVVEKVITDYCQTRNYYVFYFIILVSLWNHEEDTVIPYLKIMFLLL